MVNQPVVGAGGVADVAPVDPKGLEAALRPFGESRMLPRDAYVSQDVFDWEQRHFFAAGWICLGPAGVFLVRDRERVLRSFANACRHRNHELLACGEAVNRPIVLCPYHGWSYRLDGSLRKAPGFDAEKSPALEPGAHGLVELPCEEWHGWVFVDGSGQAPPLAEHLAGLEDVVGPYEPERLVVAGRHEYEVAANWKILTENYHECYHCPVIHPELCLVSEPKSGQIYVQAGTGAWTGGWMDIREGMEMMSLDGRSRATPLRRLDAHRRRIVDYIGIFPNLLVSLHPEYVMTHVLTPVA